MNSNVVVFNMILQIILLIILSVYIIIGLLYKSFSFWTLIAFMLMFGSVVVAGNFDAVSAVFFNSAMIFILLKLVWIYSQNTERRF